jgi:riboflavin biosynthesis pyrimidine reductase
MTQGVPASASGHRDTRRCGCIGAGLLDEMIVHVAPVLLGGGVRLFERAGGDLVKLTPLSSVKEGETTVLRYRLDR